MEKSSEYKEKNISRSSSFSNQSRISHRSNLNDCAEIIQKYSFELKQIPNISFNLKQKKNKYLHQIEDLKKKLFTTEFEIKHIENNIKRLENEFVLVKEANEKIKNDTKSALEEKLGIHKEISEDLSTLQLIQENNNLNKRIAAELVNIEKITQIHQKMKKQYLIQLKSKDQNKENSLNCLSKIKCVQHKIDRFQFTANDIMFHLQENAKNIQN